MSRRVERVAAQITRDVGQILLSKVKDSDLGFVTITHSDVSGDLKYARIFYAVLGEKTDLERTALALKRATGFVRRELAAILGLRYAPELKFVLDTAYIKGEEVMELIRDLDMPSPQGDEGG